MQHLHSQTGRRRRHLHVLLALCAVLSCALMSCGSSAGSENASQRDARATIIRFKADLDSNLVDDAMELMAHPDGRSYLAVERYELRDEISRLQRVLAHAQLTKLDRVDGSDLSSSTDAHCTYIVEFDYQYRYRVECVRVGQRWFVSSLIGTSADSVQ